MVSLRSHDCCQDRFGADVWIDDHIHVFNTYTPSSLSSIGSFSSSSPAYSPAVLTIQRSTDQDDVYDPDLISRISIYLQYCYSVFGEPCSNKKKEEGCELI